MNVRPKIIFLCGPHCCGKTTICKRLYHEGLLNLWGNEIGKEFFYQRSFQPEEQGEAFELEVTQRELERDQIYLEQAGVIAIESWHPGNLAYAAVRNPSVVPKLIQHMSTSPLLAEARGIRLSVTSETIRMRTKTFRKNPVWAAGFYQEINGKLDSCLKQLGLWERTMFVQADRDLESVYADVKILLDL